MTLSVVIPLYNEEENVQLLHERLRKSLDQLGQEYEILFVDDGSTDRTLSLLEKIQSNDKQVIVLSLRRNFGQTAAFAAVAASSPRAGFLRPFRPSGPKRGVDMPRRDQDITRRRFLGSGFLG